MAVLGILICEILELELAHLLGTDPDVSTVTVLEDARSTRLIEALAARGAYSLRRIPHISGFSPDHPQRLEVLVRVLELKLHRRREILQRGLRGATHEMSRHAHALLLGYGMCGGALEDPKELLDLAVPVFLPMDGDHPVDDCVGLILGGRDIYYAEQRRIPGTFFLTPGWARHWRRLFGRELGDAERRVAKRLFMHYERTLLVVTPVMSLDEMRRSANELSQLLGLRVQDRQGTLEILGNAWESAKAFLKSKAG